MPRNFNLPGGINLQSVRDPRVGMRAVIGLLLLANLVMAVVALHPFGGSADDLAKQQAAKESQLAALNQQIRNSRQMVDKVQVARKAGDEFFSKYFMDRQTYTSEILREFTRIATESGVNVHQEGFQPDDIEGSDTMRMLSMQVGCEGSYQNLTKFVNLVDKSPRFLLIENMHLNAVQNGQTLNVTFQIDTFDIEKSGAAS